MKWPKWPKMTWNVSKRIMIISISKYKYYIGVQNKCINICYWNKFHVIVVQLEPTLGKNRANDIFANFYDFKKNIRKIYVQTVNYTVWQCNAISPEAYLAIERMLWGWAQQDITRSRSQCIVTTRSALDLRIRLMNEFHTSGAQSGQLHHITCMLHSHDREYVCQGKYDRIAFTQTVTVHPVVCSYGRICQVLD